MLTENQKKAISLTIQFVKDKLHGIESGHDWWHSWRVLQLASYLAKEEQADIFICTMAALLHDVSDSKFSDLYIVDGYSQTEQFLLNLAVDKSIVNSVMYIVENISFSSGISSSFNKSIEFEVVQDADRLDALGAIGLARAFSYGGFKNRTIHIPDTTPNHFITTDEYRLNNSTTIMHFYEKLLSLKALMNTQTAKKIAINRHQYMLDYLKRFMFEWDEFSELP
jgi:uncharacterized protein